MYQFRSKFMTTTLLLCALPLAGCATDHMFADEKIMPFGGSKMHPIKVVNGKAVVEECGDWSDNRADTAGNEMSANHGCAVQANIAAMAAYPNDLVYKGRKRPKSLGMIHQYALDQLTADPSASSSSSSGGSSGGGSSSSSP